MKSKQIKVVNKRPVARFYYQGSHGHPVRRTVLLTRETSTHLFGYEFRSGSKVRSRTEALGSVKSYEKENIAKWGDYIRLRASAKNRSKKAHQTTLERSSVLSMVTEGA